MKTLEKNELDASLIRSIRQRRRSPIVGIIGATSPDAEEYSPLMSILAAQQVHDFCEKHNGSVFTGGVGGVGIDAYTGIAMKLRGNPNGDDRFFVLIPSQCQVHFQQHGRVISRLVDYRHPFAYDHLATFIGSKKLDVAVAGRDMEERRRYVAEVADILVLINGSGGTLHESLCGLAKERPVLAISGTGGVADKLIRVKQGDDWSHIAESVRGISDIPHNIDIDYLIPCELESLGESLEEVVASRVAR